MFYPGHKPILWLRSIHIFPIMIIEILLGEFSLVGYHYLMKYKSKFYAVILFIPFYPFLKR